MSALASSVTIAVRPADYQTPSFPSLYLPVPVNGPQSRYLYDAGDIWRYTFYWTLICYAAIHLASASYAVLLQLRNLKVIWIVPIIWAVVGGTEAVIAGSITGGLLGAIYTAGNFRMSTWIPFTWGIINSLTLVLSSFAIQGGL